MFSVQLLGLPVPQIIKTCSYEGPYRQGLVLVTQKKLCLNSIATATNIAIPNRTYRVFLGSFIFNRSKLSILLEFSVEMFSSFTLCACVQNFSFVFLRKTSVSLAFIWSSWINWCSDRNSYKIRYQRIRLGDTYIMSDCKINAKTTM